MIKYIDTYNLCHILKIKWLNIRTQFRYQKTDFYTF